MDIPKLYKYRYFNETLVSRNGLPDGEQIPQWHQVLYDGLIIPAHPNSFNDPYDCEFLLSNSFMESKAAKEILLDQLSKRCVLTIQERSDLINTENLERTVKSILWNHFRVRSKDLVSTLMTDLNNTIRETKSLLRVACFSEINDSILMWSHYAQNHQGFCIEYDLNDWDCKGHLKPVRYTNKRHYIPGDFAGTLPPGSGNAIMDAALYKSDVWSYEKEWRLVMGRIDISHPEYTGRTPACFLKNQITAVYLGAKADPKYRAAICKHFAGSDIKIYQMQMQTDSYKLTPALI